MNTKTSRTWLILICMMSTSAFANPNTMAQSYFTPGASGSSKAPYSDTTNMTSPVVMRYVSSDGVPPLSGPGYTPNNIYWNTGFASNTQKIRFEVTGSVFATSVTNVTAHFQLCDVTGVPLTGASDHPVYLPTQNVHQKVNFTEVLNVTSDSSGYDDVYVCWFSNAGYIEANNIDSWNIAVVNQK